MIRGRRVVTPQGERAASIHVVDGTIERVGAFDDVPEGSEVADAGDLVGSPGSSTRTST